MSMCDILCVTNRHLCRGDFLTRVEQVAACRPGGILLREKDLTPEEYGKLARRVLAICDQYDVPCILHGFLEVSLHLRAKYIHLPLPALRELSQSQKAGFQGMGASCHSVSQALQAQQSGCAYITAGHIFPTDCKRGVPGRGLDFLRQVCIAVDLPVYAIGGIAPENIRSVRAAGAAGVCVMSGLMTCGDVPALFRALEEGYEV